MPSMSLRSLIRWSLIIMAVEIASLYVEPRYVFTAAKRATGITFILLIFQGITQNRSRFFFANRKNEVGS